MRSRYSAFVREDATWLLATWHASTHAKMEFVAPYRVAGRAVRMRESSRFVREEGHWFYVDGEQPG